MIKYNDKIVTNGALMTKGVEITSENVVKTGKKYRMRKRINEEVFDIDDSVADNAKMISLMMTMMRKIYDIIDTSALSTSDKALMDYAFNKHKSTETLADKIYSAEGDSLVDKLIDRQSQIKVISDTTGGK